MAGNSSSLSTSNSNPESTSLNNLLQVARIILVQARDILFDTLAADEHLTYESRLIPGSTIGKHLRHARDHFELLLQSINSPPPFILSYDKRMRNTPMETSLQAAREAFSSTITQLENLLAACEEDSDQGKGFMIINGRRMNLDEPMTLNAVTPDMQALQTSFGRELWFTGLHAVHHWSMIRVIAGEMDLQVDGTLGIAPSTLLYKENSGSSSKSKM
ncbi:hypothetical protein K439DRAFT_1630802 [Ramaria rubella]|nr:hypothetical protein K439DRAFT_1630802 [Ramaria rubella]